MDIGGRIYYYRNKKGLTQNELAQGICSVSYLSKIENNKIDTSPEILNLLAEKLGISLKDKNHEYIEDIYILLEEWLEIIVNDRDLDKSRMKKQYVTKKIQEANNLDLIIEFNLIKLRYELLEGRLEEANIIIIELRFMEKYYTPKNHYYFYYFLGLYKYLKQELIESLEHYKKAENINKNLKINEPELYYLLALVHSRLNHVTLSIHYGLLAVKEYNLRMNNYRSIEGQIILAINHIRIQDYEMAQHYLTNSLRVADNINNSYLVGKLKHNFGFLYSKQDEHNEAIEYYLDSLNYKKDDPEDYVHTIYSLAKEYTLINESEKAKQWVQKGLEVVEAYSIEDDKQIKLKVLNYSLNDDEQGEYTKYLEKVAISYFLEKKEWSLVSDYAETLADYYSSIFQYKKSSTYYKLANSSKKNIMLR